MAIERFIGQKVPRLKLDNFNYEATAMFREGAEAGGRRSVAMSRTSRGYSFSPRRRR
jgi:hypothetical protein